MKKFFIKTCLFVNIKASDGGLVCKFLFVFPVRLLLTQTHENDA